MSDGENEKLLTLKACLDSDGSRDPSVSAPVYVITTHTHTHTHTHIHTHKHIYIYIYTYTHAHTLINIHSYADHLFFSIHILLFISCFLCP